MRKLKDAAAAVRRWAQEPYDSPEVDERSGTQYVVTGPPDRVEAAGVIGVFAGLAIMALGQVSTLNPRWSWVGVAVLAAGFVLCLWTGPPPPVASEEEAEESGR